MDKAGTVLVGLMTGLSLVCGVAESSTTSTAPATARSGPVGHWIFDPDHVAGQEVKDLTGDTPAKIAGPVRFRPDVAAKPLLVDGDLSKISLRYDAKSKAMPKTAITVEAWICIDKTVEWANIIGAVSGDKGWQLSYRQSSFSFGVSGKKTKGLTHLRARDSLEWGRWYHVAGTYDGKSLKVYVNGRLENTSTAQTGDIDMPDKADYVIGRFGKYAPRCWLHEIRLHDRSLSGREVAASYKAKQASFPGLLRAKVGPILRRLDKQTITIAWQSDKPMPSVLSYAQTPLGGKRVVDATAKTDHTITIKDIEPQKMYHYRILAEDADKTAQCSRLYEFDATFDYTPVKVAPAPCPYPEDELTEAYAKTAAQILAWSGVKKGWCLDLGCGKGRLAYEIARQSDLKVIGIDEDPANVAAAREALDAAGLYGARVTIQHASLDKLPFGDYLANLIVSNQLMATGKLPGSAAEMYRVLRPCGGAAWLGRPEAMKKRGEALDLAKLEAWLQQGSVKMSGHAREPDLCVQVRRGKLPGTGDWTHQYGEPGNSTCSQDEHAGGPMQVLWFGRPGPRPMVDRGTRSPAPLSTNGRLFVQGDRRLFGLDAYNGTILWVLSIPDLRRANIPRDGSNMVAAEDALYVTVRDRCWQLDPQTGELVTTFSLPRRSKTVEHDWGYLACKGNTLFGSAVKRGGLFIGADGEWYDRPDEESQKVVSDYLFALDRKTGKTKWVHTGGVVINSTLAMGDGRVYFVESRSPAALGVKAGRMAKELTTDRYMVSLDALTGKKKWEHYRYFQTSKWVFHLCYANDTLIILDTTDQYHIYGFDAKSGDPLWKKQYAFRRNHHGGAMQHPVIVGDVVYAEPCAFGLRDGKPVRISKPPNGCGTVSASAKALFFRDGFHSIYDIKTKQLRKFTGMRPNCWLSIISAGGLMLAPEGSAGCHCAWPIQTTIAFAPRRPADAKPE